MEKRTYTLTGLEVRAKSDETEGRAKGYAAVFNSLSFDLGGFVERIAPGAFKRTLEAGHNIYALWSHRNDKPLASTGSGKLTLKEDERGLYFEMDISRMSDAERSALADGDMRMSIGFSVIDEDWLEMPDHRWERTLKQVNLYEISLVIDPAYGETSADLRSHNIEEAQRRLEGHKAEKRATDEVCEEAGTANEPDVPGVDLQTRMRLYARAHGLKF
jgi:HK97 family phage prohead protease